MLKELISVKARNKNPEERQNSARMTCKHSRSHAVGVNTSSANCERDV